MPSLLIKSLSHPVSFFFITRPPYLFKSAPSLLSIRHLTPQPRGHQGSLVSFKRGALSHSKRVRCYFSYFLTRFHPCTISICLIIMDSDLPKTPFPFDQSIMRFMRESIPSTSITYLMPAVPPVFPALLASIPCWCNQERFLGNLGYSSLYGYLPPYFMTSCQSFSRLIGIGYHLSTSRYNHTFPFCSSTCFRHFIVFILRRRGLRLFGFGGGG